ncbi:MAG: septum formation initiator family protein, partial [Clostridiaceae bacterium]|nr:septum formation initiator family protein [Clostridiaceae bacterium]
EELKHTLELYQSDEYNERLAREKLGLVKPGEQVFIDASGR